MWGSLLFSLNIICQKFYKARRFPLCSLQVGNSFSLFADSNTKLWVYFFCIAHIRSKGRKCSYSIDIGKPQVTTPIFAWPGVYKFPPMDGPVP